MLSETDLQVLWKDLDSFETELGSESKKLNDVWSSIQDIKQNLSFEVKR